MFKKVLIANRGEIAVRIIRTCRDLGISTVSIYSEVDRSALHVALSDEACYVGEGPSSKSYLKSENILEAARKTGAEAIHPGYGFLAENDQFAQECADSGIVFVGPSPSSITLMGDKIQSRKAVERAGVRVVPGSPALALVEDAKRVADKIGFPILIKASAGGGGKGMRVVREEASLSAAFREASSEAEAAFGDPTVYIEKYIEKPRHIEFQILADQQGNYIHLGERECSIQRRHQKLLEETPAPGLSPELREEMGNAAIAVARAADYFNAGTVEFLVDSSAEPWKYYFLEMNTRLQVEHPITECVTGLDLVREQLEIACGNPLRLTQEAVRFDGAAMECRIYAEDPSRNFFPSPGVISDLVEPSGPGVRNDSGVSSGFRIPVEYDPLISKLVTSGADRREVLARMRRALKEYRVGGVRTTIPFFLELLRNSDFKTANLHTHFIEEHDLTSCSSSSHHVVEMAALAAVIHHLEFSKVVSEQNESPQSEWKTFYRRSWS